MREIGRAHALCEERRGKPGELKLAYDTVEQVIEELTVEEKAGLITGGLPYGTKAVERLGIPAALMGDSMAGMNFRQLIANYCSMETGEEILSCLRREETILNQLRNDYCIHPEELNEEEIVCYRAIQKHMGNPDRILEVTSFPAGILMGAAWNPSLTCKCAEALAREFDTFGVDVILTPNVNIQRDPLAGRLFESFSEDPFLTGVTGSAFVSGIQQVGLLADPKHFSANNHEKERKGINIHVSERALREIYFPGFEACVKKGNARTIMSAYNKLNGKACSANHRLLTEILREEWGFDGMVISDWGGVYESESALKAGNDLEMPKNPDIPGIIEAVGSGEIPMEILDTAVRRILKALLEMPCMKGRKYHVIDREYSEKAAYEAVCEGTVLLKNDGVLPMPEDADVYLAGAGVHHLLEFGSGSAEVLRRKSPDLCECMEKIGGTEHVFYEREGASAADAGQIPAGQGAEQAEYVIVVGRAKGQEGTDRKSMLLDPPDQRVVSEILRAAKAAGKKTVLVLNIAGPVDVREYEEDADAVICVFIPGCQGSRALADIIYGRVNPSGKLALTFPEKYEDTPTWINFPGYNGEVWYGEGVFVGYRYYDTKGIRPKYPFGFGLSYTDFEITGIRTAKKFFEEEKIRFDVEVKNTGNMAGKEVVQIYIHHENPTLLKPYKELKAYQKVELKPGESAVIPFGLDLDALASYDEKLKRFAVEPGIYRIMAGNSSRNIMAEAEIAVKCPDPYGYGEATRIAAILQDQRCLEIYERYFGDKCELRMYHDLLGYTPDYPAGKALRERIPENMYAEPQEKETAILAFFEEIGKLDLGKLGKKEERI